MKANNKTIIIIAGPTAVGKTSVGIAVAKHFGTEIISADSRQCFRELDIGVARPTPGELAVVPHHFIASHSIEEKVTAATFEEYALEKAAKVFETNNQVVVVGGTGLYIKALVEGLDEIPEVPQAIHDEVVEGYRQNGIFWLQEQIRIGDIQFYLRGEIQNPQRLMRALEVLKATGRSIFSFRRGEKKERDFAVIKIALDLQRDLLYSRINRRVEQMMEQGLLKEAEALLPYQHLNALQTVGYKELFDYFAQRTTLAEAISAIQQNTRHYAKRQLTWFRKDKDFHWLPPDPDALIPYIVTRL